MKYLRIAGIVLIDLYLAKCAFSYAGWHFIDTVNLIFHEAGHSIFSFFGEFIHVAAGSAFQILLPLAIAGYFFYQRDKVSAFVVLAWAGQNMLNVSVYARDAIVMQLDLLGGDAVMHDWNYLLSSTGNLAHTYQIAQALYIAGMITLFAGIFLSSIFCFSDSKER